MIINDKIFNCDLEDVITELQTQLTLNHIPLLQRTRNTPTDIMVQCPYHGNGQERKPSAGIKKDTGIFHCFACGEAHPLPEVISFCFGYHDDAFGSFGWKWLNKNFSSIEVEARKSVDLDLRRFTKNSVRSTASDGHSIDVVGEEELDKYRYTHPYWKKRGITDEGIIELFDLGYDKETDCITFPVRDIKGRTLFVARRSVKTKFFNYPAGAEKPLYGLYELCQIAIVNYAPGYGKSFYPNEVIVCESMLDALTAWQYGKYAVALNGLGNERQFKELRELPCRKLILATDNDEAGLKARKRIREKVHNKIITEYALPEGKKDLNELTEEEFKNLEEIF